jgi:hypothetical protein
MDDTVGDYDVSGAVSKWKMEIVTHGSGPPVALHGESERNATAVQSDAAKAAPSEKPEDATGTAADIEHQGSGIETLDEVHERARHDRTDFLGRVCRDPVERVLIVKRLLLSCGHF